MSVEDLARAVGCVRASLEAEQEKEYSLKTPSGYEKFAESLFSLKKKKGSSSEINYHQFEGQWARK